MKQSLAIVSMLLSLPVAAETTIECPRDYPVKFISAQPPPGWKGIAHAPEQWASLNLVTAGVVVGPPDRWAQASQMGEEVGTPKGIRITFHDLNGFVDPQSKWVYCLYGVAPRMQLLQRVPDNVDICVADVRKDGKTVIGATVKCR